MTKITITISDQERSFSATVEPTLENIVQAVDAALQAMGWNYNTIRNTIYELYREKMEMDDMFDQDEYLAEKIKQATPNWRGVDTQAFMDEVRGREPEDDSRMKYRVKWKRKDGDEWYYGSWSESKKDIEAAVRWANSQWPKLEHYVEEKPVHETIKLPNATIQKNASWTHSDKCVLNYEEE